jgi:hypothetical protein
MTPLSAGGRGPDRTDEDDAVVGAAFEDQFHQAAELEGVGGDGLFDLVFERADGGVAAEDFFIFGVGFDVEQGVVDVAVGRDDVFAAAHTFAFADAVERGEFGLVVFFPGEAVGAGDARGPFQGEEAFVSGELGEGGGGEEFAIDGLAVGEEELER